MQETTSWRALRGAVASSRHRRPARQSSSARASHRSCSSRSSHSLFDDLLASARSDRDRSLLDRLTLFLFSLSNAQRSLTASANVFVRDRCAAACDSTSSGRHLSDRRSLMAISQHKFRSVVYHSFCPPRSEHSVRSRLCALPLVMAMKEYPIAAYPISSCTNPL